MSKVNYKAAGVDIQAGNEAVSLIKQGVESTFSKAVLTGIGSFGAMYDLADIMKTYQHPVLVQSIDGVGTKMMVAKLANRYDTIGIDLVSATANDIVVLGAKPLTLLDYIANDHLNPQIVADIVGGMVKACRDNEIALVGGETAEMPGTYLPGEHDLVGIVTGVVEKDQAILGTQIQPGDVVLGITSSGLHTNGYSLARKLLFEVAGYSIDTQLPALAGTIGEVLLAPHLNYTRPILQILSEGVAIHGMAHITGGGLLENIPRVLPSTVAVEIHKSAWPQLPIFDLLRSIGELDDEEMYRAFNMGIGMVVIVPQESVERTQALVETFPGMTCHSIGRVILGKKTVRLLP